MTAREFVENIWGNAIDPTHPITLEEAKQEVEHWKSESQKDPGNDWEFLDELTPEYYMSAWNALESEAD